MYCFIQFLFEIKLYQFSYNLYLNDYCIIGKMLKIRYFKPLFRIDYK